MTSAVESLLIVDTMLQAVDIAAGSFTDNASAAVSTITPTILTFITLYIMIWGWAMARGMVQEPVMDAVMRFAKLVLVFVFATRFAVYAPQVRELVFDAPDKIAQTITGLNTKLAITTMEVFGIALKVGGSYITDADALSGSSGVPDLSLLAIGIGVWGGGAALTGIVVGTLVIANIILAILLAVGPIFIMMILFESTKKLFDAWLGQVVSYMIVIATTIIASTIVMQIMTIALAHSLIHDVLSWLIDPGRDGLGSPPPGTGIGLIVIYGICGVAIQKIVMAADAIGRSVSLTSYVGYK